MNRASLAAAALLGAFSLAAPVPATASARSAIPRDSPTTQAARPVLGPNRVATGDRVPWEEVGHGWFLTLLDQGTRGAYGVDPHHQLLDLVDPRGGRYQLAKSAVGTDDAGLRRLMDWSVDGRRALVMVGEGTPRARAIDLHLRSGRRQVFTLDRRISTVSLGPHGSLFATQYGGNGGALLRLNADGTHELLMRDTDQLPLPTRSGHRVVVAPAGYHQHTFRVLSGHGAVVRTLSLPHKCSATRWWSAGTVLASCYTRLGGTRLYAVPIDGSAPSALTATHGRHSADLGDLDARVLGGTTYLEAAGPCGVVALARQRADGSASRVRVPESTGNVYLLGTRGRRLVLQTGISCDGGGNQDAITHFDPSTHANRAVAKLPVGEAYDTVLAFGERHTSID